MASGADGASQNAESLRDLVNRVLANSNIVRLADRKSYEVHPALPWPLPSKGFKCRFLGVNADQLKAIGISPNQEEMDDRSEDLLWLAKVALQLARETPYKTGGYWHLAMSRSRLVDGANQQRLLLYAMVQAATKDMADLRSSLLEAKDLPLVIPTKSWAQRIAPLDGSKANQRDDEWNRLALGRTEHWIFGSNIQSEVIRDEIIPLDILGKVDQIRNSKDGSGAMAGAPIRTTFHMRPAGVAFAIGLRGRVNSAANGAHLFDPGPIKAFESWLWDLNEGDRRLLAHIISCPATTENIQTGQFEYLRKPWSIAAIMGSSVTEMSRSNKQTLLRRLQTGSAKIIESAPDIFRPFAERALTPFLAPSQGETSLFASDDEALSPDLGKLHTPPPGFRVEPEPRETTYATSGNPIRDLGKSNTAPQETTYATSGNYIHGAPEMAENNGLADPFKKEEPKKKEYIKTQAVPQPESALVEGGITKSPSMKKDQDADTIGRGQVALPLSLKAEKKDGSEADRLASRGAVPAPPRPAVPPAVAPLRSLRPVAAPTTFRDYEVEVGMVRRDGVFYVMPGQMPPKVETYALPAGSRAPKSWTAEPFEVMAAYGAAPASLRRFPVELICRLTQYKPVHEQRNLPLDQVVQALIAAPEKMGAHHVENLLRMIDTAPDNLVECKVEALRYSLSEKLMANVWFNWGKNLGAVSDWPSLALADPYRAHAAASWRLGAHASVANLESVAGLFADWWHLANVRPKLLPTAAPIDPTRALDDLQEAILGAMDPDGAERLRTRALAWAEPGGGVDGMMAATYRKVVSDGLEDELGLRLEAVAPAC
jgi:hypothetical protein